MPLTLAGCATAPKKPVGDWAYEFRLSHFTDLRPDDDMKLMAATPFRIDDFMHGWQANVGRSLFNTQPANLDVTLHSYEATRNARSYALTMETTLRGSDQYGREIAKISATCNAVLVRDVDTWATMWGDFWQQPKSQRGPMPLTASVRDVTMWQKVMDSCTEQLATDFGNALAARSLR